MLAKASAVASAWQRKRRDRRRSRDPLNTGRLREQISPVGRTGVFLAAPAITQIKAVEFAVYLKTHSAAQAGAGMNGHRNSLIALN